MHTIYKSFESAVELYNGLNDEQIISCFCNNKRYSGSTVDKIIHIHFILIHFIRTYICTVAWYDLVTKFIL